MSQQAEIPSLTWGELGVSELLPTGTVTLLLADVEGSTRLWETQPEQMTAALSLLNRTVDHTVAAHDGVRPVEQGEGDSFVAAFARASDAVACALALQRAQLAPIRLRIGLHTGEIQLRDEANYAGPTINRTARIRDLAHGGQTVMSGVTESLVIDRLPDGVWLDDLGSYPLRGVPRPERVVQLCHPDLRNDFPPLRVRTVVASHNLPVQLTSFVGRQAQMAELSQLVTVNRLMTLTGAGGAGKTRLAVELAAGLPAEFPDGVWYIDLAPITNPAVAPVTVARTLGLAEQQGLSVMDTLMRFFGERKMLLLLDNCEHLLDACGTIVIQLLGACPRLTILATSREPLAVPGELSWRVPSLSLADEAVDMFTDRARRARPDFVAAEPNLVEEICRRLDGMPLAIELAAARVRALSLAQILDSLHDRFRLLTGGARTAVRRQQTLRASVDWSHALLTEPERVLFRRLAAFMGSFDLDAAQAVGAANELERYQLMDLLTLLVDKSLVTAIDADPGAGMRYRLLETVRQYALEKLGESGEADEVRDRHRDYFTATSVGLESTIPPWDEQLMAWAELEVANLRAAYGWSREKCDYDAALRLVSSLAQFWVRRGRVREGLAGFDAILNAADHSEIAPTVWARAVADHGILSGWVGSPASLDRVTEALAIAHRIGDESLIIRTATACGMIAIYAGADARPYLEEAIKLAAARDDRWSLCQIHTYTAAHAHFTGDPVGTIDAARQGLKLADELGDGVHSQMCRTWVGLGLWTCGELAEAGYVLSPFADAAQTSLNPSTKVLGGIAYGMVLAHQGRAAGAHALAESARVTVETMGGYYGWTVYATFAHAALAEGNAFAARQACDAGWCYVTPTTELITRSITPMAEAALGCGDLPAARRWADDTVAIVPGCHRMVALTVRALVAMAQGQPEQAERDAQEALTIAAGNRGYLRTADTLECLARLAADGGNFPYAARLLGAANALRQRLELVRYPIYQDGYEATLLKVRESLGEPAFDSMWAEGSALSIEEAIAYAQRGRGERKRPASGWGSLTPMELDVVRLVAEGLGNKEIGGRLFISPRTVQSHLTHVYAKLGLTSRVQLVQESGRQT
nr:LuxR family transcriptional regulator [Mycobacterium paragordonae]